MHPMQAALVLAASLVMNPGAVEQPNIIYVMLDDAGYGDFGAFGSQQVRTPAMDRMCREGTMFTQHYSGSCVCAPTRCVLMTGLHTGHARRRDNQAKARRAQTDNGKGLVFLRAEDRTVAAALKQAGYVTGGIGKWGLGNPGSAGVPERQGFDMWYGYLDQVHAHDHYTAELWDRGRMVPVPGNRIKGRQTYVHDLFEERTLAFIREHRGKPFFLYLAYTLPHGAYVIPHDDPAYRLYAEKPWSQSVRHYAAMITRVDRSVGTILDLLQTLDLHERTIVFYTSDNGPNTPFLKDLDSSGGLRGIKRRLYEGGLRAALAVRWPGRVPAGRRSDFVWDMRDVFPTFCDLAGAPTPAGLDGISVLPTLLGREQTPRTHLYWEFHSPFQQAVRLGDWKGIRFGTEEAVELYDLKTDAAETKDVAARHPEVIARMADIMTHARTENPFWPTQPKRKR